MKKSLIILALLPLLFFGCKKGGSTDEPKPEEKLFKVTLKAKNLVQSINPISLSASNKTKASVQVPATSSPFGVDLLVYNEDGFYNRYHSTLFNESGTAVNGGDTFSLELPKGKYTVYALGYHGWAGDFYWEDLSFNDFWFEFGFEQLGTYIARRYSPLYVCKSYKFDVINGSFYGEIDLKRFNAQLELEVTGNIPENVEYVLFGPNLPAEVLLGGQYVTSTGSRGYVMMKVSDIRNSSNKILSTVFYPREYSTDIINKPNNYEIVFLDKDYNLLSTRTVNDVIFKENHITKLSGDLFEGLKGPNSSGSMSVNIIEAYENEIIEKPL